MAILSTVVSALSTFYQDSDDPHDPEQVQLSILRLMAKLPTIAAYAYKKSIGQPFLYPDNSLDLIENFLTMMFAVPSEPYEVTPDVVHALKQLLILHADHEQNCSTSTVRMVGSSEANLFASIAAGHQRAVGPAARRREPGRHRDAADASSADGGDVDKYVKHGQGPRRPVPALRLRPPRLQELRPAGAHPQGAPPTACIAELGTDGRAARHRAARSRRSRSPTSTSSSASSTRTSTSTRASSTGRWASPPQMFTGPVRDGPAPRLDRALEGDDGEPEDQDRPPPPDLHRPHRAPVRPPRPALTQFWRRPH